MSKRRTFGSIRKLKSGKFLADFPNPTGNTPQRIPAPMTFARKMDADKWLRQQQAMLEAGTWKSPELEARERVEAERKAKADALTFGEFADTWFERKNWAPSHYASEESRYRNHLKPYWGGVELRNITTQAIEDWIYGAHMRKLTPANRRKQYDLLKQILRSARFRKLMAEDPFIPELLDGLKPRGDEPSGKQTKRVLPVHELHALVDGIEDYLQAMILLMGLTGLRLGEVRALHRSDIDLEAGTVFVHRSMTGQGKNSVERSTTKTPAGTRLLPLAPVVIDALKEHFEREPFIPNDYYVFQGREKKRPQDNEPVAYSTPRQAMHRVLKREELKLASPHDLRHTAITFAARIQGVTKVDLQAYFGHSKGNDVTARYIHTDDQQLQLIADGMNKVYLQSDGVVVPLRRTQAV